MVKNMSPSPVEVGGRNSETSEQQRHGNEP
jgi:hypothetical protein